MNKHWKICHPDPKLQAHLSDGLGVHPIIAQLLINRDITAIDEARDFLAADLSCLHDPYLLKNMDKAVARIRKAQRERERVFVVGDYDVDGVTSSALLNFVLTRMGIELVHHIPHRMQDGYGLNEEMAKDAKAHHASLVIAVDCGITALREVDVINALGMEVIIFDHHEPDAVLPNAYAIVNPKQNDCPYPFKHLASVGLVTKLTQALLGAKKSEEVLDLAAIGTVADVVPLRGENRIFVKSGLPKIAKTNNHGLMALLDVAKIRDKKLTPFHIGFVLGPRINAAGRMDSARTSLDLFLSTDPSRAYDLAKALDRHNLDRQKIQREVIDQAMALMEGQTHFKDQKVIVLQKEGWHKGVLGIVASKLTDKYYRPSIVISVEGGIGTASARSIEGFHLHEALSTCARYLEHFGGHAGAAGLTIKEENIDPFRSLINEIALETLTAKSLVPTLEIDCEIPVSSVDLNLAGLIDSMQPFGEGNPAPIFCSRGVTVKSSAQILGKNTLKFWVHDGSSAVSAVGFGMAEYKPLIRPGHKIDLVYEIGIDDWNKSPVPQLVFKDLRVSPDA